MKNNLQQQIKGFTLIEVLLAVAIFAMISLASFSIFDGVITSEEASKKQISRINEIQKAWLVIERDLIQIAKRKVRYEGEEPLDGYLHQELGYFTSDSSALAFVRHGWSNPGMVISRSDIQSVAYRLEDSTFERLHYNYVDAVVGQEPKIRKLITDVEQVSFEFFYNNKWQVELKSGRLPHAIKVIIEAKDLGQLERKFIVTGDVATRDTTT